MEQYFFRLKVFFSNIKMDVQQKCLEV